MSVTIASTTDSQEAVNLAAGLEPEPQPAEETKTTNQNKSGASEQGSETPVPKAETAERQDRSGKQERESDRTRQQNGERESEWKRNKKLTARVYEQDATISELRERLSRLEGANSNGQKPGAIETSQPNGRPNPSDPKYQEGKYDQYIEDLADWKAGERIKAERTADANTEEQERVREVFDTYNRATSEARATHDDFDEVVGRRDLQIPQAAQVAIIEAGEIGPEIAYYLGSNPDECQKLAQMSPARAASYIGKIEAKLSAVKSETAANYQPAERQAPVVQENKPSPPPQRPVKPAPAPITPVGASSNRSSVSMDQLPYRDYKRLRDQEERSARGR